MALLSSTVVQVVVALWFYWKRQRESQCRTQAAHSRKRVAILTTRAACPKSTRSTRPTACERRAYPWPWHGQRNAARSARHAAGLPGSLPFPSRYRCLQKPAPSSALPNCLGVVAVPFRAHISRKTSRNPGHTSHTGGSVSAARAASRSCGGGGRWVAPRRVWTRRRSSRRWRACAATAAAPGRAPPRGGARPTRSRAPPRGWRRTTRRRCGGPRSRGCPPATASAAPSSRSAATETATATAAGMPPRRWWTCSASARGRGAPSWSASCASPTRTTSASCSSSRNASNGACYWSGLDSGHWTGHT